MAKKEKKEETQKEADPIKDWDIHFKLVYIQGKLRASKVLQNSFGNYNYRSNETIIQAVKPLLEECELTLIQSDGIELIGDRFYLKATSTLSDGKSEIKAVAYAQEPATKKGMDVAQITGASSSYARKYSLNGLFAIDDSKDDPDSKDNLKAQKEAEAEQKAIAKKEAFDKKVKFTIEQFEKTSNNFTTMVQWDKAVEKIENNRKNKNAVAMDPRFYNFVIERYNTIKALDIEEVEG
jgi:hypothetical protein